MAQASRETEAGTPGVPVDENGFRIYEPDGPCLGAFLIDRSEVAIIRGPIGSGTSSAACMRIMQHAQEQRAGPDGVRRSRWGIIRNTYPDLRGTTVKTWLDWFPEELYGKFYWEAPYEHHIKFDDVEIEVLFLALDDEASLKTLRSREFTAFWFNELEFIDKVVFDEALSRIGRYPAVKDGGTAWAGILADMNAPPENHWVPMMMGEAVMPDHWSEEERSEYERPEGWCYIVQPPAMTEVYGPDNTISGYEVNPGAENLKWLRPGYYHTVIKAKKRKWIESRVLNRIVLQVAGDPVWKDFRERAHVANDNLLVRPEYPVYVGLDFGRRPAAVFAQCVNNRWIVQGELVARDMGATNFAPLVKRHLEQHYPGCAVYIYGDPKGRDKTQADEKTAYMVFAGHGMQVQPAPVKQNNINTRIEAVEYVLTGMTDGMSRLLISPNCIILKRAMAGGYRWKKATAEGEIAREPVKDGYSDVADALQYLLLGAGEGRAMTGRPAGSRPKPVPTRPKGRSKRRYRGAA